MLKLNLRNQPVQLTLSILKLKFNLEDSINLKGITCMVPIFLFSLTFRVSLIYNCHEWELMLLVSFLTLQYLFPYLYPSLIECPRWYHITSNLQNFTNFDHEFTQFSLGIRFMIEPFSKRVCYHPRILGDAGTFLLRVVFVCFLLAFG